MLPRLVIAEAGPPIDFFARTLRQADGSEICLLGISNKSVWYWLKSVTVALVDGSNLRFKVGPIDLAPEQRLTFNMPVSAETNCIGTNVYYRVSYQRAGISNEMILPTISADASTSMALSTPFITGLFSALSGIVGGLIALGTGLFAHRWTLAREREKDIRAARAQYYEDLEPKIGRFLENWGESVVPETLQGAFHALRAEVYVDYRLVQRYEETYRILSTATDEGTKKRATKQFALELTNYVRDFDPKRA